MNWAWATSLDHIWRSPTLPMWLTLAAAGFFGVIALITLVRAEKSVANGALTVITLLAIGVAVAATLRSFGSAEGGMTGQTQPSVAMSASPPALSCIDDLAGETVLTACEKVLFGSAETTAAAVSYAASMVTRLTASGNVARANSGMTPELASLRRAVERDRYGLIAYVLLVRDHCSPSDCAAFRSISDSRQIVANMNERAYDGLIIRYSPLWNAPPAVVPVAALAPPSMPTGKPTNADFPTAASTPAVSIMSPEPGTTPTPPAPRSPASASPANAPLPLTRPAAATAAATAAAPPSAPAGKKQASPKRASGSAPVQLAPAASAPAPAPAPETAND